MTFENPQDALYWRLGHLTQAMAELDLNIGLAVNWLGQSNGLDISNLLDPSQARLTLRLNMLKKLVDITFDQRTEHKASEFASWFTRANNLPALKNNYIHANWNCPEPTKVDEPFVLFKVPVWNNLSDKPSNSNQLKLSEFDAQIDALKNLSQDLIVMFDYRREYVVPFCIEPQTEIRI